MAEEPEGEHAVTQGPIEPDVSFNIFSISILRKTAEYPRSIVAIGG